MEMHMDMNCSACMSMMMDMMKNMMTFHFGYVPMGLLFPQWTINSVGELIAAIIVVFILAILYEGLKTLRELLIFRDLKHSKSHTASSTNSQKAALIVNNPAKKGVKYYSLSIGMHLLQSALHVVQVGLGYLLMLVAMTFNGWLFLAVCFGAGVGYLLFAKSRHIFGNVRESNEHCH